MQKRGAISIEMIIIVMLAVLTLVIVAVAFTGGMAKLWAQISGLGSTIPVTEVDAARATCNGYCTGNASYAFCCQKFSGNLDGKLCKDSPISVVSCDKINCGTVACL